jgi:hypothetical protein
VKYNLEDKVILGTKNIVLKKGRSRKLLPRFIGPVSIIQQINEVAFKIDLPVGLRMHNVFHISLTLKAKVQDIQPLRRLSKVNLNS